MKVTHLFGMLLMVVTISMGFVSCEKDDESAGVEMRLLNNGSGDLLLLTIPRLEENGFSINNGYTILSITASNNFHVMGMYGYAESEIVCVGNVSGLNRINSIPNVGWAQQVAVQPGQGYVIRRKNYANNPSEYGFYLNQFCTYARVYVVDWLKGTSGGIIGAIIRYQDDWQ